MNLSQINTNTLEGRIAIAAMSRLSVLVDTQKQPDEILNQCLEVANEIYKDSPLPDAEIAQPKSFLQEITEVINRHSRENESNTPDFILAGYVNDSLKAFEAASRRRENWYGKKLSILDEDTNWPLDQTTPEENK